MTATDKDIHDNAEIIYSILIGSDESSANLFDIDEVDGRISTAGSLAKSSESKFTLTVVARDSPSGESPRTSVAQVMIHVRSENTHAPVCENPLNYTISEALPPGTPISSILVSIS